MPPLNRASVLRLAFYVVVVLLVANVGALVDLALHPAIPYADAEHLVVGLVSAASLVLLFVGLELYLSRRRRSEAALRASTEMRDIAEGIAHVGSWRWNVTSGVVEWSPQMRVLYDGHVDDFGGDLEALLDARVHPDDREWVRTALGYLRAPGTPPTVEWRVVHRDGSVHVIRSSASVVRGADGAPELVIGYVQDVTDQREIEAALRSARDRLDFVLSSAAVGVWDWDIPADLATWTETTAVLYGMTSKQLSGPMESFYPSVHPDDLGALIAAIERSRGTGGPYEAEFRVVNADGAVTWLAERGKVTRDATGDPVRMSGVTWDVTERRQALAEISRLNDELEERVLQRTVQLEAANRELESFVYSAAHDLRAPLRAIDGFSEMVAEDAAERLLDEDKEHLQRVRAAAQRMALLIDQLMALSRASRQDLLITDVDVSAAASSVLRELHAGEPGRTVETVVEPDMLASADAVLLRDILANLLGNAWKFTGKHETARIEVGTVRVKGERAFFVRDDGAGFNVAMARQLFGPFQRFHSAEQFPGDGIGLATVQRLVARHGGRAWAEAEVERGATFYFTLPEPSASA
jgi:PAS domain S-box-containing protein